MPLYDIQHSVPLTKPQKQQLADKITHLHATTFTTPSLFVNMQFTSLDPSDGNYFIAGKPRPEGYNRITGMVRTSESRTKKDFDNIAEKIEQIWDEVVRGIDPENEKEKEGDDKNKKKNEESESEREAKKLRAVFLYPMVAARENGVVIPTVSRPRHREQ